jgi:hypothetical protein
MAGNVNLPVSEMVARLADKMQSRMQLTGVAQAGALPRFKMIPH